jgi:hypothetical protein
MILECPRLLGLFAQQLATKVVEHALKPLAKQGCLKHPGLLRHHHTVEKDQWFSLADDVVMNANAVELFRGHVLCQIIFSRRFIFADSTEESESEALARDTGDAAKVAIVAAVDVVYGLFRVFEVYRESKDFAVRVFRDFDEAQRWLQEGP